MIHLLLLYILTELCNLGFDGVCYAVLASNLLNFCNVYAILWINCRKVYTQATLQPCKRAHFRHTCIFLKTGVPAALMVLVEWLVYDILVVLTVPLG